MSTRAGTAWALFLALAATSGFASSAEQGEAKGGAKASRVRVLRSWSEPVTLNGKTTLGRIEVSFDYDSGLASRRIYDGSGALVSTETFPPGLGQPRPSDEEIQEAMTLVRSDAELARIIDVTDATLDGGFLLKEEAGKPCGPGTRCLQIQLNTNGYGFVRNVVVDLTKGSFAYRVYTPPQEGKK